jgi:hypothetical protein
MSDSRKQPLVESTDASRRRFLRELSALGALAVPVIGLGRGLDTGEGVTFADGPRPLVRAKDP